MLGANKQNIVINFYRKFDISPPYQRMFRERGKANVEASTQVQLHNRVTNEGIASKGRWKVLICTAYMLLQIKKQLKTCSGHVHVTCTFVIQ